MSAPTADETESAAQRAAAREDWAGADALIGQGLGLDPAHAGLLKLRLTSLLRRGRWRKAYQAYDAYLRFHPNMGMLALFADDLGAPFLTHGERLRLYSGCLVVAVAGLGAGLFAAAGPGAAVAAVGILAAVIAIAECCYRLALHSKMGIRGEPYAYPEKYAEAPFFLVQDRASQTYHPLRGYDLVPDNRFLRIGILRGRVVEAHIGVSDINGNSGFTDTESDGSCVNIVVLGDSYTSLPGNGCPGSDQEGVEWPAFFKKGLVDAGVTDVRVLNYARAGHGVLQMADTAVSVLERHKPDIFVFAFNTLDLARFRYWHKTITIGGAPRCFRGQAQEAPLDQCAEESVIDPRITLAWAKERIRLGDSDELLDDICRRQQVLRRRATERSVDMFAWTRLYSWDRLFFGTPFIDVDRIQSPRVIWWKMTDSTYDGDSQFAAAIKKIRDSGARIVLAHIPRMEDLVANDIVFKSDKERGLMESLGRVAGEQIFCIGNLYKHKFDDEFVERKYPRYPHDAHPSLWAQKLLGLGLTQFFTGPLANMLKKGKRS